MTAITFPFSSFKTMFIGGDQLIHKDVRRHWDWIMWRFDVCSDWQELFYTTWNELDDELDWAVAYWDLPILLLRKVIPINWELMHTSILEHG